VNASGDMGMQSPKSTDATEDDFKIVNSLSVLIDTAKSEWARDGLLTVTAPDRDYENLSRPISGSFDLGAYEYRG